MAGTSVLKLKVDDKEYNSSLKKAQQGLQHLEQSLKDAGKSFTQVDKSVVDYVRGIGQMEAQSKTARGRISEMSSAFIELSLQYKNMSNEVKSSDVGKALAESMEQLKQRTIEAKNELESLSGELNNVKMPEVKGGGGLFSGMGDKMSGAIQVFAGNMMTKAAGAVAELGSEIFASVQQGIELARQGEGIRIAFERLGRGDILQGLREATHGTVTDLELMKAAVKFNDFKLPVEELGTMLAFAQQKAKDTGQSVDYMVDSIVTGLGRKSLMILDNLGLSANEIKEKMAETGDMTKAVGAIIREQMSKAGDYVETAADRAAQANVNLQNKMEELGRKFAPVEEASSQLWTSMKIGILDIIGGPLATLLNQLTEAGRLKNQLNNMNGEPGSGNTKVQRMIGNLSKASDGNRQGVYDRQVAELYRYINRRENYMKDRQRWVNNQDNEGLRQKLMSEQQAFGTNNVGDIKRQIDAAKIMLADYRQAAKQILSPVKADIDTKGAEQNVESLKVKLIELEAQRKKAIAAGDTDLSKNLSKQISQVKSDIKGLGGTTTTTTTHKATPQEKADETYKKAQQDYQQALDQAALEVKAGTINSADAKKKELQAAESLWKSIGDARETYDSPKLKDAQAKVEQDIIRLGGEVTKAVEAQKRSEQAARELETAQKKLADAQSRLAEAQKSGNLKDIYAAEKNVTKAQQEVTRLETIKVNVEKGTVDLPDIPKEVEQIVSTKVGNVITPEVATDIVQTISTRLGDIVTPEIAEQLTQTINTKLGEVVTPDVAKELTQVVNVVPGTVDLPEVPKEQEVKIVANTDNISAQIAHLKEQLGGLEIGSLDFNQTQANLVDMTTLQSIVNEQMKAGLKIDPETTKSLMEQITKGFNIEDSTWQKIIEKYNKVRKQIGEKPINIDFRTGEAGKDEKNQLSDEMKELSGKIGSFAGGLSSISSGLKGLGIELPKEVDAVIGAISGISQIISGVGTIISLFGATEMTSNTIALGTNTVMMAGLIDALVANAAISLIPFANGGIVPHAAGGWMVPGNDHADRTPVLVSSGELILNSAQQNALANELQGNGMQNLHLRTEVSGRNLVVVIENDLKARGKGQLATFK